MFRRRTPEAPREPIYTDEDVRNIFKTLPRPAFQIMQSLEPYKDGGLDDLQLSAKQLLPLTETRSSLEALQTAQLVDRDNEGVFSLNRAALSELMEKAPEALFGPES